MQEFTLAIISKKENTLNISQLETIANEYPYFQFAKAILVKKYRTSEHFKYNNTLKNLAANTINREVLFDYITHIEASKKETKTAISKEHHIETRVTETNFKEIVKELDTPLEFTTAEKHSFTQWLQISDHKPIERKPKGDKNQHAPLQTKLNTIDQFLQSNPKISPLKKHTTTNSSTEKNAQDKSNQLMTETLAKVYIAQKKYNDAIQAYKILSLKYPEKSSFFADQIKKIEILQKNIS